MIFKMKTPSGICVLFFIFLTIHRSIQKSTPASLSYRAAVVEYEPTVYDNNWRRTIDENLDKFVGFIDEASRKNVDIVVFPELGISTLEFSKRSDFVHFASSLPKPSENYTPCTNSSLVVSPYLKNISCAAQLNSIYVIVNIVEKERCSSEHPTECPIDGFLFYTSNVAFDRNGKIIARYRKSNGYNEYGEFDKPKYDDVVSTIETDFGVTFGNAMSRDIFYEQPGLTLTTKYSVNDIVYPTVWYSKMPFMTAIQTQAGWAHAKDVNLLAGGYNRLDRGIFGSGIYAGRRGIVKSTSPLSGYRREILIAEVMKKPKKPSAVSVIKNNDGDDDDDDDNRRENNYWGGDRIHDELRRRRDTYLPNFGYEKLEGFETRMVDTGADGKSGSVQKLNHNGIVCEFKADFITNLTNPKPIYRYVAFDGDSPSLFDDRRSLRVKICAVLLCANETIQSCGRVQYAPETFRSIEINASFENPRNNLMTPNTLDSYLIPLPINRFDFRQLNEQGRASISLTSPSQNNLITFGLWGRNFDVSAAANFHPTVSNVIIIFHSLILVIIFQNIHG